MDPLDNDTPALGRSSLDRIHQLRERPLAPPPPPSRPVLPWVVSAVLLAFALGLIANPWFEARIRSQLPGFAATATPSRADLETQRAETAQLERRIAALEARPAATAAPVASAEVGALATRMGTTNARIDAIGTQVAMLATRVDASASATQAALASVTHDAEAAQSVLLLGVTRRALERGERLAVAVPSAEPALQSRFGAAHGAPLAAVLALGNSPVTPRSLARDLATLAPTLTGTAAAADAGWWDTLTASLSSIVRVRESGGDGVDPVDRVAAAQAALLAGNVDGAVAQIAALPADKRRLANGWLVKASRLRAGLRGLAILESAALAPLSPVAASAAAPPPAAAPR
jgi:hypothetical protein